MYDSIVATPIRLVPLFTPESIAMPSMINNDLTNNYANGAATIGLRISGNLHGEHIYVSFYEDLFAIPPPESTIHPITIRYITISFIL